MQELAHLRADVYYLTEHQSAQRGLIQELMKVVSALVDRVELQEKIRRPADYARLRDRLQALVTNQLEAEARLHRLEERMDALHRG